MLGSEAKQLASRSRVELKPILGTNTDLCLISFIMLYLLGVEGVPAEVELVPGVTELVLVGETSEKLRGCGVDCPGVDCACDSLILLMSLALPSCSFLSFLAGITTFPINRM